MYFKSFVAGIGLFALAACGATNTFRTDYADVVDPQTSSGWRVSVIEVNVSRNLTTTEANGFAPSADIVWRGDPVGDRYAQVDAIITEAATRGAAGLHGNRRVKLVLNLIEFHALSQKTRYSLEDTGVHNISFTAQVFDVTSGEALTPSDIVQADLIAFSGHQALEAEEQGNTQRVRIVDHVSKVVAGWIGSGSDSVRGPFQRRGR